MHRFRAVVFDLDGTLVDSLADITAAVNATLAGLGRPPLGVPEVAPLVGWGLKQLWTSVTASEPLEPTTFEASLAQLKEHYRAHPVVHTRPYPGLTALVDGLRGRGRLGVLSNKDHGLTDTIVTTLFPGAFDARLGNRPGVPPKPDPTALLTQLQSWGIDAAECAFVGDSAVDMETAVRAGAEPCGVLWGYRDEAELRGAGARQVFGDAGALGAWLSDRVAMDKPNR